MERRRALLILGGVAALAGSQARADIIYGLNGTPSGGIYKIDTTTKTASLYRSTPLGAGKSNGLAYDAANDTFYYIKNSSGNHVIRNKPGSVETDLGIMASTQIINSGTFYNGMYWVQPNLMPGIIRVTPGVSSFTAANTPIAGYPTGLTYGDIASDSTGMTWASQSSNMRRYNLNSLGSGSVALSAPGPFGVQLAFGPSGLWGMNGTVLYMMNTTTGGGLSMGAIATSGLSFIDLASAPTPGAAVVLGVAGVWVGRRRRWGTSG